MIEICPEECEHNIPFVHRAVTSSITVTGEDGIVRYADITYIVCAYCGHWIENRMPGCRCVASCHSEARSGHGEGYIIVVGGPVTE